MKKITKSHWLDFISSPFVLALPIAMGIIIALPDVFQKYIVTQTYSGVADKPNSIEEYRDLDNDGYSERVIAFTNELGLASIKLLHNDGSTIDQWNFSGKYPCVSNNFICADLNNDSIKEIYVFTLQKDTLYLHAFNPFTGGDFIFLNKPVSVIDKFKDSVDVSMGSALVADLDSDGFNELLFIVNAGYSKQPRGIFAYNARKDTIIRSPKTGAKLNHPQCIDLNEDNKPEIYCSSSTSGNYADNIAFPFNDYSSWVMGFNEKLEFLFPPIKFDAYQSGTHIATIQSGGKNRIVVYFLNKSKSPDPPSMIALMDESGKFLRKKSFGKDGLNSDIPYLIATFDYKGEPGLLMNTGDNSCILLDTLLNIVQTFTGFAPARLRFKADLDRDGEKEMIFTTVNNRVLILRPDLRHPVHIKVDNDPFSKLPLCISLKKNGNKLPELFIKPGNKAFLYTYSDNKLYYLKYPLWLGIYLVIVAIIWLILYVQRIQLQRKMEVENRLNALQLKTIKGQMDPHFMFNALNSISTSILNRQNESAHRYLIKFSNMLRLMFTRAGELTATLGEQLKFVENYLKLEKLRFKDRLSYEIDVDPAVNLDAELPRMFIQLFVENAIKHGLRHKKGKGHILIKVTQTDGQIRIIIRDDGIGRQAAAQHPDGHGTGLKVINEMTTLFEKVKGIRITYRYEDLTDEDGDAAGTRVVVEVPVVLPELTDGA